MAEPSLDNPTGLNAPAAVAVVTPDEAPGLAPVDTATRADLGAKARAFVDDLVNAGVRSPAFAAKVDDIAIMGQGDLRVGGRAAQRMLQRSGTDGGGTARVTAALTSLRRVVDDLDPGKAGGGLRRLRRGDDLPARYFGRYRDAQTQLDAILRELVAGQDELRRDNAAIDTEQSESRATMTRLSEYATLAAALDDTLTDRIAALAAQGQADAAAVLRDEALMAVRRRRQDVLTHLAVATQGHLALDVVRANNLELIRGVELARRGTLRALRAAIAAAGAVAQEQLVLDRITALDTVAARDVTTGALSPGDPASGDLDGLRSAFRELTATMDELDRYRAEARANLDATTAAVRRQATASSGGSDR